MIDAPPLPEVFDVPSITQQTPWPCKIFNFGPVQKPGVDFFNCSLVERDANLFLVTRRATWDKRDKLGFNDIVVFQLDWKFNPLVMHQVNLYKRWPHEHFEDPRAECHDGRVFITCCNFLRNNRGCTFPHQIVCEVDKDWKLVARHDPVYGYNGNDIGTQLKHEKNWGIWRREGGWCLNYSASPHVVIPLEENFQPWANPNGGVIENRTHWEPDKYWRYGQIRGGGQPVLHETECWAFFHSSLKWKYGKNQYFMGAYAFERYPPFRITKITTEPLLIGSDKDPWTMGKPPCVFPGSAIIRNGVWLVPGGLNDIRCFLVQIPHNELIAKMTAI